MKHRLPDTDIVRVPLTPAQAKRLQLLQQQAAQAAQLRDTVFSAIIEGATDRSLEGWQIQIAENELVLMSPPSANGVPSLAPADGMKT